MNRRHVLLLTGASGFIGSHLAQQAIDAGFEVRAFSRQNWTGSPAIPAENRFFGELPSNVPIKAFEGVDTLIHLAALTRGGSDEQAHAVNVEGSRAVLHCAKRQGLQKAIFLSSQSVRSDATSSYARTKADAEKLFIDAPLATTILRPGLVYGPGRRGLFARMRRIVRRLPFIPILGAGQVPIQPIHVGDLGSAILRCVETGWSDGRILHVGAPQPLLLVDFLRLLSKVERGRVKPAWRIPLAPLLFLVALGEKLGLATFVTTDNLKGVQAAKPVDTAADLEKLGLRLRSLEQGLREVKNSTPRP